MEFLEKAKADQINRFKQFHNLLLKGGIFGIDLSDVSEKINTIISSISDDKLKVALVGGFSEGKTTVAASWIGRVEDNMKIDPDESSDELQFYRPEGLESACEIVDTPGLFGDKTFEDGGKYQDQTKKYVSEAHLILYVVNPVNPLKESHQETLNWLFRDLGKIDSVIFVINKMDDIADLSDPEDFNEVFEIKKKNIIDALKRLISLSPSEESKVNIVGIAANPKGKGLNFWMNRPEDYNNRSRILNLRNITNKIIENSKDKLIKDRNISVIKDIAIQKYNDVTNIFTSLNQEIKIRQSSIKSLKEEYNSTLHQIKEIKHPLTEELITYKTTLLSKFNSCDISNIGECFQEEIGNDAINFNSRLNNILERYSNISNPLMEKLNTSLREEIEFSESMIDKSAKILSKGANGVKMMKIGQLHSVINTTRNFLNANIGTAIKFKPWGITKLAKGLQGAATVIGILIEGWEMWSSYKKKEEFEKSKKEIISFINSSIDEILGSINTPEQFINMFAPNIQEMGEIINSIEEELNNLSKKKLELEDWIHEVKSFSFNSKIEDIEYEEVK